MDFINDFVKSIPGLGHGIAGYYYLTGDSKNGRKAFCQATRATATIVGGTVGCMMAGPGGAVAGSLYSAATFDTIATAATEEEHGYIKHTGDFVREVAGGNFPLKAAVRAGLQIGFDAAGGRGMNVSRPNSVSEMTSTVGHQIYKKSLGMNQEGFCKKFTKQAIKHDVEMALKLIPDNRVVEKNKRRKKKLKKKDRRMVDYDSDFDPSSDSDFDTSSDSDFDPSSDSDYDLSSDSDFDPSSDSDSKYIRYRSYPYFLRPEFFLRPFPFGFNGSPVEHQQAMYQYYDEVYEYYRQHYHLFNPLTTHF